MKIKKNYTKIHKAYVDTSLFNNDIYVLVDTETSKKVSVKVTSKRFSVLMEDPDFFIAIANLCVCLTYGDRRMNFGRFQKLKRKLKLKKIYKLISTVNDLKKKKDFYTVFNAAVVSTFSNFSKDIEKKVLNIFKTESSDILSEEERKTVYSIYRNTYDKYFDDKGVRDEHTYLKSVATKADLDKLHYVFLLFASYFSFGTSFEEPDLWN